MFNSVLTEFTVADPKTSLISLNFPEVSVVSSKILATSLKPDTVVVQLILHDAAAAAVKSRETVFAVVS